MSIEGHTHIIDKSKILLFKSLEYITCEGCGMSLADILRESKNDKTE